MTVQIKSFINDKELYSGINREGTVDFHIMKNFDDDEETFVVYCLLHCVRDMLADSVDPFLEVFEYSCEETSLEELIEEFNDYVLYLATPEQQTVMPSDVLTRFQQNNAEFRSHYTS